MGWPQARLGDVADIVSGSTPKTGVEEYWNGDIPWVTPADLTKLAGHAIFETPRNITALGLAKSGAKMLPAGAVLFSSRAPIGHVAIAGVPMATNQGFKSLVPASAALDAKYLFWWLRCKKSHLQRLGVGATFKELSKAIVAKIEIPLPPLPEQRRIASILDELDAIRGKRRNAIAVSVEAEDAALHKLLSDGPDARRVSIREIAEIQTGPFGSLLHKSDYVEGGIPLVNPTHIRAGRVEPDPEFSVTEATYSALKIYSLHPGDVVLGRRGEMGRAASITSAHGRLLCGTGSLIVRPRDGAVLGAVLAGMLSSPLARRKLEQTAQGVTMLNLNQSIVGSLELNVPSMQLQVEFDKLRDALVASRELHQRHLAKLDELFESFQHRAFRTDPVSR